MRELPAGRDAVLLDFSDTDEPWRSVLRAADAVRSAVEDGRLAGVTDVIPTAHTVLVQASPDTGLDRLGVRRSLRGAVHPDTGSSAAGVVVDRVPAHDTPFVIGVVYDGADLATVADATGLGTERVVATHTGTLWRVQFMGFAPGFGYLVPHEPTPDTAALCALPRRPQARPAVPAGSVALAAGYSAVYPRASPGGWNLLGRSDIGLFDVAANPPAALAPGRLVRFEAT